MGIILKSFQKAKRKWVTICLIVVGSVSTAFVADSYFEVSKNIDIFTSLCREVSANYVDPIKPGDLVKKGIDAMLSSLDPYTMFIPESDIEDYKMTHVSKQYGGVGALIHEKEGHIYISEPYEGFPAQKGGLWAGDELLEVNGRQVKAPNVSSISEMLKGQKGTPVKVVLKRGNDKYEKTLTREEIKIGNVPYFGLVADGVGYIKLTNFLENSGQEVKEALIDIRNKQHVNSVIIDLRGNGGGILQEAVKIVNLFVNRGNKVVSQRGKSKEKDVEYYATEEPVDTNMHVVVLVDRGSASASEIVTGAMQELDRGVIIGQRTFGKGLVQQTMALPYNSLLKVTIAKYYTPSGRCIQALDYTHRNTDGSVDKVADSLITEYKTKHGRFVYDGSGIYPDVKTEPEKFSNISFALSAKLLIFDYSTQYRYTHNTIAPAKTFEISDKDYEDFVKFTSGKDYKYTSRTEAALEELKKNTENEKYYDVIRDEYKALEDKIAQNKKEDLIRYKDEIKQLIETEIASRYYYQKGKIESTFKYDKDIKEAINVLRDNKLYASVLNGDGNYRVIGKPKKKGAELTADSGQK